MKVLVLAYNAFSDQNANGKTLKALLHAFSPDELAQFYCGPEAPDFSCCKQYFRATDADAMKAFFGKSRADRLSPVLAEQVDAASAPMSQKQGKLLTFLKKHNYNFLFRSIREFVWCVSPWGKKKFYQWVKEFSPDALLYMVGDSRYLDKLVMHAAKKYDLPVVLYNCEAYRLIDLKERKGIERRFYRKAEKQYARLLRQTNLVVYNCDYLRECYERKYGVRRSFVAYNAADFTVPEYQPQNEIAKLAYFGNLGVGRVPALLEIADVLQMLDNRIKIDVYGKTKEGDDALLLAHPSICYHGLVAPETLESVKESADILLHMESFEPSIVPKLRYAFSTKIAQCLCAGRCFLTYAPRETVSTQYLLQTDAVLVATTKEELTALLADAINNKDLRIEYACKAKKVAECNHNIVRTGMMLKRALTEALNEN